MAANPSDSVTLTQILVNVRGPSMKGLASVGPSLLQFSSPDNRPHGFHASRPHTIKTIMQKDSCI